MTDTANNNEVGVPDEGADKTADGMLPDHHEHPDADIAPPVDGDAAGTEAPGAGADEPWGAPSGAGDDETEEGGTPVDGINDQTGEYGPGVDQDTGAAVGDTGTPELASATSDAEADDAL